MADSTVIVQTINWVKVASALAAGLCMGIGSLGPSLGQGYIGGKACESISRKPESASVILKAMLLGMAFTESSALYALAIALILIFVS